MKKIESGEIKPIRAARNPAKAAPSARKKEGSSSTLAALGIEFAPETPSPHPAAAPASASALISSSEQRYDTAPSHRPFRRSVAATPATPQTDHTIPAHDHAGTPQQETISLAALAKPQEQRASGPKAKHPPHAEVSIESLRNAIKASLAVDLNEGSPSETMGNNPAPGNNDDDYDEEEDRSHRNR